MYYQVGAATIRQIPYPGSGTNFPYTEKPRNSDHVGSEFRGKDTAILPLNWQNFMYFRKISSLYLSIYQSLITPKYF